MCSEGGREKVVDEVAADPNTEAQDLDTAGGVGDRHSPRTGEPFCKRVTHEAVGTGGFHGTAGGDHEGSVADMCNFRSCPGGHSLIMVTCDSSGTVRWSEYPSCVLQIVRLGGPSDDWRAVAGSHAVL